MPGFGKAASRVPTMLLCRHGLHPAYFSVPLGEDASTSPSHDTHTGLTLPGIDVLVQRILVNSYKLKSSASYDVEIQIFRNQPAANFLIAVTFINGSSDL